MALNAFSNTAFFILMVNTYNFKAFTFELKHFVSWNVNLTPFSAPIPVNLSFYLFGFNPRNKKASSKMTKTCSTKFKFL